MKLLYAGLDETERGRIVQKLQEMKIPYRVEDNGDVLAPGHQIAEVRAKLAMAGVPNSGSAGNLRMNEIGMSTPGPVMDQQMRVAMEEELEKTIGFMSPVAAAKVHIAPGDDSPFADAKVEPSASVVVQLKPGTASSGEVAEAIVRTMSTSIPGLDPKNISVSSADGQLLWDGKEESDGGTGIASKKRGAEIEEASRLKREIESMITRTIGASKAIVSVNVEMNYDKQEVETLAETPSKPVVVGETREVYGPDAANAAASGSSSTAAQPAAPGALAGAGGKGYVMSSSESAVGTTREKKATNVAPGKTISCRVSIMLDESAAAQQTMVEQFCANLIGADKDPENFKVAVSTAKFDTTMADTAKKELAAAKSGQMMQQIISLIPVLALVVVGFLVTKAIGKAAINNSNVLVSTRGGAIAALGTTAASPSTYPTAGGDSQPQKPRLSPQEDNRPIPKAIPEKYDENLEAILHMAEQKPEKIALLVKSWILEETR